MTPLIIALTLGFILGVQAGITLTLWHQEGRRKKVHDRARGALGRMWEEWQ